MCKEQIEGHGARQMEEDRKEREESGRHGQVETAVRLDRERGWEGGRDCLLYTSPSPRDGLLS
eukprot:2487413-Pleurochrysis_carterae.AAC.1